MFKLGTSRREHEQTAQLDFSQPLGAAAAWSFAQLGTLALSSDITAYSVDPVQSLLAVGTADGELVILGSPAVQVVWHLPRAIKIKFLALKAGSPFLCVVDASNTLHVFDYSVLTDGKPTRDSTTSIRSEVTCTAISPALSYLFLGLSDGTIETYDIDRGCISPSARIKNNWLRIDELNRRSGVEIGRNHIPICVDLSLHPLDPSLLLIAYEGGVALYSHTSASVVRSWEFLLPPGALGGGSPSSVQFRERRLGVTCIAWRADAQVFAVGHEDGAISFVAVAEENPLTMRTLERVEVDKVREEDLFGGMHDGDGRPRPVEERREPVYKLTWSAYPTESLVDKAWEGWSRRDDIPEASSPSSVKAKHAGETTLTVLGGLLPSAPQGLTIFTLPPFLAPPASSPPSAVRHALLVSLVPSATSTYATPSPAEDFLLLPRSSPHMNGTFDPVGILITTERHNDLPTLPWTVAGRGIESWSFPPRAVLAGGDEQRTRLKFPGVLGWSGNGSCTAVEIFNVDSATYQKLTHQLSFDGAAPTGLFKGGNATARERGRKGDVPRDSPSRILVSAHVDLSIRFHDISSHLISPSAPDFDLLQSDYPNLLAHLTIDFKEILRKAERGGAVVEAARLLRERPWELEIKKFAWAREAGELSVAFNTGDLLVTRFRYGDGYSTHGSGGGGAIDTKAHASILNAETGLHDSINGALADLSFDSTARPSLAPSRQSRAQDASDSLDLSFVHSSHPDLDQFHRVAAYYLPPARDEGMLIAHADIGFLAFASGASLVVVDLRERGVMLCELGEDKGEKDKGKNKVDKSAISSLKFTVCSTSLDSDNTPRLIVCYGSGTMRVFKLEQVANRWTTKPKLTTLARDSLVHAIFVLDRNGEEIQANSIALQNAKVSPHSHNSAIIPSLCITVAPGSVSTLYGIDGSRIAHYQNSGGKLFGRAFLVRRFGCPALVTFSKEREITLLSLPMLVPITKFNFESALHTSAGVVSCSTDGDIVQILDSVTIRLFTLFDFSRYAFPPNIELYNSNIALPPMVNLVDSVKSSVLSVFGGRRVSTVAEIDGLLGGSNRPPPKVRSTFSASASSTNNAAAITAAYRNPPPTRASTTPAQVQSEATYLSAAIARTQEALSERGERLNSLSEALSEAGTSARNYAIEAKKMAQQEAAKRTLMGGFSSYFK